MKIKISKTEMQKKLSDLQSIIEKKTTMPILSHFLMEIKNDKSTIYATDLETAIKEPIEVLEKDEEVTFCLPAKKLYEISREVEDDIIIESDDSNWIKLKSGKSLFKIASLSPDDFPLWPTIDDIQSLSIHSNILLSMIEKTIFCSGEDDTRFTLNGLLFHFRGQDKELTIVGTDGHRLAAISKELDISFDDDIKVIIPRKAAIELRKFLLIIDENISISITKTHIKFILQEKEFLTKLIDGTYPNYEQVIPQGNDKILLLNREIFIKSLRRVSVMSRERSYSVKFNVEQGQLNIFANDPEIGEASDMISIDYNGEPITLAFNAKYVLDALISMESENVVFELQDISSPTLLKEEANDKYKCVVMPMRI